MKKILIMAMAVVMLMPMLFSCQGGDPESTKYGTAETAVKVTVQIENPDYVEPTTEPAEGEEVEVDPTNPEYFYNGTVELYVSEPTVADALKAVFGIIKDDFNCSIDDDTNEISIDDHTDSFTVGASSFWEYTLNNAVAKASVSAQVLKEGDSVHFVFTSTQAEATTEATAEATAEATTEA